MIKGKIRGTEGTDGDKLDVYVGDNHDSSLVVVIHQHNPWDGKYDEDKVVIGCESVEEAIGLYKKQYDRPGFYREGEHTAMPIGAFWRWVHEVKNKGKRVSASVKLRPHDQLFVEKALVLANKVKPESDRISAEKLWESPIGKLAADKWVSVPRLDLNTIKDAIWVKWVRITSSGQMSEVVARRLPNGWNAQLLKSGQKYDPKDVRGRPRKDPDLIKLFTDGGGSTPYIVKGAPTAAPAATNSLPEAQRHWAVFMNGLRKFISDDPRIENLKWTGGPVMIKPKGQEWLSITANLDTDSRYGVVLTLMSKGGRQAYQFPARAMRFPSIEHFLGDIMVGYAVKHAPAAPTSVPSKAAPQITTSEVTSFLKNMSTKVGGRNRDVDFYPPGKNGFQSPFWSAEPSYRQRLDHYVGSFYNPGPDDDPEGWDSEGWEEEYAGPLHSEVQKKLDARFGKGLFSVDIGEKGHIDVYATKQGQAALGLSKQGAILWKKGYAEGQPGALNAAKVVFSNLLAMLRAVQWNHLTSHWQIGGDSSYGDHLLFERLYTKAVEETDALAEKLVGTFGIAAVDALEQAKLMAFTLVQWADIGCPFERGLHVENTLRVNIEQCLKAMEDIGQLSIGMDDFLRTMVNDHETHLYLLQQRQGGVRMASATAGAKRKARQQQRAFTARCLLRLGAQVGTDTASIYAIAPEQLANLISGAKWADRWNDGAVADADMLVRQHGGAVWNTGSDGTFDVEVPDSYNEGEGLVEPYGTPDFDEAIEKLADEVIVAAAPSAVQGVFDGIPMASPRTGSRGEAAR